VYEDEKKDEKAYEYLCTSSVMNTLFSNLSYMPTIGNAIVDQELLEATSGNRIVSHNVVICLGQGEDREGYETEV
jgi:hypothetical protein